MTEIEIRNYQSIGHASIVVDGFTVVVGTNNIGKSAVVRAIKGALTNEQGSDFIRLGQKEAQVSFKRPGLDMVWKRGATASYKVNGDTFTKLKGAVPPPLLEVGFQEFEVNGEMITPLIADQFNELFLLDRPGSFITDAISSMYNLDVLGDADDLCQKDSRAAKTQMKTREEDLASTEEQLAKYKDLDALKQDVVKLAETEARCDDLRKQIEELTNYQKRLQESSTIIKKLRGVSEIRMPDHKPCGQTLEAFQWLDTKTTAVQVSTSRADKLGKVSAVHIPDGTKIPALAEDVSRLDNWADRLKATAASVKKLKVGLAVLGSLPQYGITEKASQGFIEVQGLHGQLRAIADAVKAAKESLGTVETQLKAKVQEKGEFKVCPLCEQPLGRNHA